MFTLLYRRQEFFRCSYFVYNNFLEDKNSKIEEFNLEDVARSILIDHPKIHVFEILWDYPGFLSSEINGKITPKRKRNKNIKKEKKITQK